MEPYDADRRRGSCLTLTLTGGLVCFLSVLLVLATGGWAVYMIGIGAAIASFGAIHYVLWGRLMLHQTAGEREEEELRRRAEERGGDESGPASHGIQRFP